MHTHTHSHTRAHALRVRTGTMFFVVAVVFSRIPAVHNRTRLQNINTLALNYAITISCLIIIVSTHIISITFKHTSARTAIAETRCGDRVPACARNTGSCKRLDAIYSERIAKQSMLARIQSAGAHARRIFLQCFGGQEHTFAHSRTAAQTHAAAYARVAIGQLVLGPPVPAQARLRDSAPTAFQPTSSRPCIASANHFLRLRVRTAHRTRPRTKHARIRAHGCVRIYA